MVTLDIMINCLVNCFGVFTMYFRHLVNCLSYWIFKDGFEYATFLIIIDALMKYKCL